MFVTMAGGPTVGFAFGFLDFAIGGEDLWGSRGLGRGILGGAGKASGDFTDGAHAGGALVGWRDS